MINYESLLEISNHPLILNKKSKLLAVTKNRSIDEILSLVKYGHTLFGENKVQEAHKKFSHIDSLGIKNFELHLIGHLQSNKSQLALETFDTIQSIDRKKLVDTISALLDKIKNYKTKNFFIQVNIGNENQKNGVHPQEVNDLYKYALLKKLNIVGIMCIPPTNTNPIPFFKEMVSIRNMLNTGLLLSMGMSNDYQIALDHQSDIIRVGSKIFK
jgi:pyridoxal phosphate enzyme (YggS family)